MNSEIDPSDYVQLITLLPFILLCNDYNKRRACGDGGRFINMLKKDLNITSVFSN